MLGFSGHFSTKSRTYSTTLGALRTGRAQYQREQAVLAGLLPDPASDGTLVLSDWHFAGRGRHLHATTLLLAGVPVHVVAARLGHADPAVTLRVYSHGLREHAAGVGDIFAQAVNGSC
jgi:integrase